MLMQFCLKWLGVKGILSPLWTSVFLEIPLMWQLCLKFYWILYLSRSVCESTGTYCYGILYANILCYRKIFDDCRDNLPSYFKDGEPVHWTFHPKIVFERFQSFLKRLETIKVLKFEQNSNLICNKVKCF